jgi:hypothetical protein
VIVQAIEVVDGAFMPPAPTFGEENSGALRAAPTEDIVEKSRSDQS